MTFVEAVHVLKEKGDGAIKRESSPDRNYRNNGTGTLADKNGSAPVRIEDILAEDWVYLKKKRMHVRVQSFTPSSVIVNIYQSIPSSADFYAEWYE